MKYDTLLPRFLGYVKQNTRSDEYSKSVPSTKSQVEFLQKLVAELNEIGLEDVKFNEANGYVTATIPATTDKNVPVIGLISHVDTADFNADGIDPQIVENYDGKSVIELGKTEFKLDPAVFPSLKKYAGQTLITTDGTTLLGSDDKSGVAEIVTLAEYLIANPDIEHGKIRVAFGPDEEIGTGADRFDVADFAADFAYTVDGGPVGQLEYETFSAIGLKVDIQGTNVHPSEAKGKMISAVQLAVDFHNLLPESERAETTEGREGFYHLLNLAGTAEDAHMDYIIRDFERAGLENKRQTIIENAAKLNANFSEDRVKVTMVDQYFNMVEVMRDHMDVVELAEDAMKELGIELDEEPVRGGTDGSKISFMGLPTPNLFAGGENMHGRYEYVALESMEKAVDLLLKISELNTNK